MSKLTVRQRIGMSLVALLSVFSMLLGPVQAFAAPVDASSATFQALAAASSPTTTTPPTKENRCEERKDALIAKLERRIGDVEKRIADLKARIAQTDNDKLKARLERQLDKAQHELDRLHTELDKVRDHKCPDPTTKGGKGSSK